MANKVITTMENPAKLTLSATELKKVMDTDFFLTKQTIIASVYELFKKQASVLTELLPMYDGLLAFFPLAGVPKIYKGENYKGLPYVMMDYPRKFEGNDIFAVRTFFWWGNHFSIHLLLKGVYKEALQSTVERNIKNSTGIYTCVNSNAWQYNFEEDNYVLCKDVTAISGNTDFLKFGIKIPLAQWNSVEPLFAAGYHAIGALVTS